MSRGQLIRRWSCLSTLHARSPLGWPNIRRTEPTGGSYIALLSYIHCRVGRPVDVCTINFDGVLPSGWLLAIAEEKEMDYALPRNSYSGLYRFLCAACLRAHGDRRPGIATSSSSLKNRDRSQTRLSSTSSNNQQASPLKGYYKRTLCSIDNLPYGLVLISSAGKKSSSTNPFRRQSPPPN